MPELDVAMDGADAVIVVDFPEAHQCLDVAGPTVHFSGPLVREISTDKWTARAQLGIEQSARAAVLTLGSSAKFKVPDVEAAVGRYLRAWAARSIREAALYVLVDQSFVRQVEDFVDPSVRWVGITSAAEAYYAAANVLLTSSSLNSLALLGRNGLRGIAMIGHVNRVERLHGEYFAGLGLENVSVVTEQTPTDRLAELIDAGLSSAGGATPKGSGVSGWGEPAEIAGWIAGLLD
jgi:hypothetical protein